MTSTRVVNFCLKNYNFRSRGAGWLAAMLSRITQKKSHLGSGIYFFCFFSLSFGAKLENGRIPRTSNNAMGEIIVSSSEKTQYFA